MSKGNAMKTGKEDFSKFRISAHGSDLPVAQKVLMHVPVAKPNNQRFVRVKTDANCRFECPILRLDDDTRALN